ncbi:hypothetical protein LOTGIDRAFT_229835 [Lottia gigantea]|uniref:Uncharacterized protein n=1 Tax=Lottia gigantea TaxID=225164 RepID=V4B3C2_LOTGI|nr:hypothetical protein LOTGIDRAFT_229835 [Lottia gigantea]ESO82834.1 hypothetical protein LOTGIDRAFT_229835 [Lottia gigantea]
MPRQKKTSPAGGYHKVISTGNGEFANYNKVVQAFGCTGTGRGLLRHSINEPQGPREYERMENIPERPSPRPRSDPLLTELSNFNADSGSSLHDFDSDDRSDISVVDKQSNTRRWINSAASYIPRSNYHGAGLMSRYGLDNTQCHSHPRDQDIIMSRLEYQLHLKERQLAFTTSIVEQQNRFLYEQLDGFVTMPPMRRIYGDNIDNRSVRMKPNTDKNLLLTKPATAKQKHKKTKIDSAQKKSSDRLLELDTNHGSNNTEVKKHTETIVQDKNIKPSKKKQYEQIQLESMLKIAEDICHQGCPYCYIERFGNLEEYSDHIKQKSHIKVKKLVRKRSDTIIKELIYNNSMPNTENGLEFIQTAEGYYCQLCQLFFCEEIEAKVTHCDTDTHNILYKNLIDNSDAIEKALADEMIKTQNQNLNETDLRAQHSSSLIDSKLSQDIRDLCLDKLEEVLAEKEQISFSKSKGCNSVMFTECSDLEKGFFAEQEVKENRDSRTLVKKTNISFDTMTDVIHHNHNLSTSTNVTASKFIKTQSISNKMNMYTLSDTATTQCDMKLKYYGFVQKKKESDDEEESNDKRVLMIREQVLSNEDLTNKNNVRYPQEERNILPHSQKPTETATSRTNEDISLPYKLQNTGTQYDMKCKYYGSFQSTNDSSSNSDEEYALTNIKDKVAIDGFTTFPQNSTWSPQEFTSSDALITHKGVQQSTNKDKPVKIADSNCIQHQSKTCTEEVSKSNDRAEVEATNSIKEENLNSHGYDTDSDSVVNSDTDFSNTTSTNNVNRDSTTNSCLSDAEIDKADDLNELDTTIKEDLLCYKCLKEFEETSILSPGKSTAVKTDEAESCSKSHASEYLGKECTKKTLTDVNELPENISKSGCLSESYLTQDGLEHMNSLSNNHNEKSKQICDISLYSDCDKPDDQHITEEHVMESEKRNRNNLKHITSITKDYDNISDSTKYSISVQKDLDPFHSDLDLLPSTSFNYTTALDFDINGNSLVEHNDFEVDGFVVYEGISCRNILTQTYSMVTPYDSSYIGDEYNLVNSYMCDEDSLLSEEIEVKNTERQPPDGIEDKKHKVQVYETSENNCFVAGTPSLPDIKLRAEDLDRNEMSDDISYSDIISQTTHVDCEALIHVIDSVIGEQQQTTEKMISNSYNQPLDISAEEDSDKLDMACRRNEHLNFSNTYYNIENKDNKLSGKKSHHQCVSNIDMLPAFCENKDDSGITDDYDEGFVCPRNSPQLWARYTSKQSHSSSNNLEKEIINANSDICDIAEWISSQEAISHDVGLFSVSTKKDTIDNVCFDEQSMKEMEAEGTFFQTSHGDIEEFGENPSTAQENGDLFVEETDIIIQVRNCDITVETSETLSIDICEDTTIASSFIENQSIDLLSANNADKSNRK